MDCPLAYPICSLLVDWSGVHSFSFKGSISSYLIRTIFENSEKWNFDHMSNILVSWSSNEATIQRKKWKEFHPHLPNSICSILNWIYEENLNNKTNYCFHRYYLNSKCYKNHLWISNNRLHPVHIWVALYIFSWIIFKTGRWAKD